VRLGPVELIGICLPRPRVALLPPRGGKSRFAEVPLGRLLSSSLLVVPALLMFQSVHCLVSSMFRDLLRSPTSPQGRSSIASTAVLDLPLRFNTFTRPSVDILVSFSIFMATAAGNPRGRRLFTIVFLKKTSPFPPQQTAEFPRRA